MDKVQYNYIDKYIFSLQAEGKYTFSFQQAKEAFPDFSAESIRKAIIRMSQKERLVRIWEKFYVIVPPEYSSLGLLPPDLFIDDLMNHLQKPYYVGLLSAAAKHGAAHQQPQSFQVITTKPTIRSVRVKGINIKFHFRTEFSNVGLMDLKTDTGYVKISGPSRTLIDLILFKKQVGGIERAVEVIDELLEKIDINSFSEIVKKYHIPVKDLQRLGYILDCFSSNESTYHTFSDIILEKFSDQKIFKTYLENSSYAENNSFLDVNERWKVIDNVNLKGML